MAEQNSRDADVRAILYGRTNKDKSHIDGMDSGFAAKLAAMLQDPTAPKGLGIYSGYRSVERQAELWKGALAKYGSPEAARKWVAPPGNSQHNHGKAADLAFNGQSLKHAPKEVVSWVHSNSERYGLKFPLGNENWHVEDSSTRGGEQTSAPTTVDLAREQNAGADTSVKLKDMPPILDEVLAAGQKGYDARNNPLSGGNIPFSQGNPNNVPPEDREEFTLGQLQSDAWNTETTSAWLFQSPSETDPDNNWSLTTSRLESDLKSLGADAKTYGTWLSKAHSEENYQETMDAVRTDMERNRRLTEAGVTGTALRIANAMLDPTALAVDAAASTVAPELVGARRAERLHRILSAGVGGAAGGLATEAVGYAVNPHKDASDMLYGSVFGFGVGGVVGALTRNPSTLTEAVNFQRAATVARQQLDGELPAISMAGSAGAARAPIAKSFLNDEALEFTMDSDIEKSAFLNARLDLFAQMDKSPNPLTRVAAGLVNDGVGKKNGAINGIAASEEQQRYWTGWATNYMRTYRPALEEYRSRNSGGWMDGAKIEAKFNREVSEYILDRNPSRADNFDPAVVKMGNRQAALYAEVGEMGFNPYIREGMVGDSVKGFERWERNPHYMMRQWDANRIVEVTKDYVDGTVEELIAGAIRKAQADMDEALIGRLAKGFTRAITNRAHGLDDAAVRAMGGEDVETLMEVLTLEGGLSRADADAVLQRFKKTADAGDDARAKHRLLLAEKHKLERPLRKDGTVDEEGLSITDLINMDASSNFLSYARHMSGIIALSRYRFKDPSSGELLVNGFKSDGDFEHYKQLVRRRGAELIGEGKMTREQVDKDIDNLDMAYSSIRGRPINKAENTDFGWWSRAIRKVNFTRIMNQVGFAQVSEIGATIGTLGFKAAASQVPAVRRMMSQSGETILKSGLADDLEVWLGTGTERLLHRNNYQLDEVTGLAEVNAGRWRERVDGALNKANNVTAEISGMRQANIMLERWTSASIIQKFANMAATGKGMSKERLADLGLDPEMTDRIFKMFNEPGNMEYAKGSITGRKVTRAHFGNWADKEAREAFLSAADRLSRQIIQRNDIGNMIPWMSHPAAKMLMQFRTFMVGAYTKQTLKSLHFRDGTAVGSAIGTMAMAGAAYVAQTKIQAVGRSDRKEWEDKRLSWSSIGTASFARAGASSVVPMLVDTGLYAMGQDALFSHTRTTGQASNMLFGNPTTGGVDDVVAATRALTGLFENRDWSQEEARQIQRVLPFGNSVPIMMLLNGMISDLPDYAPRDRD
ncbi:D-alanyl-D-alanine carboxypeptidase family protein [Neorhizobium sp. S3-V5DH]|uniref:D-alanyl-D-alanine carboxypeptidase family protein n=1 Tax=Neorhizobium sp. S3-V5DH TaxID=2485166 RepID=UPI0010507662|nr:D-alanyl-D-alanine carboxypeptidase family protein [Neorhizobium sp. S3-V5DH]TCV62302.1 D-alanyl-D-alanine carboxypeptidase-like protein [Neorhizobium sp. S3-V5DH]